MTLFLRGESTLPPRLLKRTLVATFGTVAFVLVVVFVMVLIDVREHVRRSVAERLDAGQRVFSALEARRQRELQAQVGILADSPTLKAALDTYATEWQGERVNEGGQLLETMQRELDKLVERFPADVIAITDVRQRTLAVTARHHAAWPVGYRVPADASGGGWGVDRVVTLDSAAFRAISVPLMLGDAPIGQLYVATALDDRYAAELSDLSGAETAILLDRRVVGSTFDPARQDLSIRARDHGLPAEGVVTLGGEVYALRRLFRTDTAEFYAFGSVDRAAAGAMREARRTLAWIAGAAFLLAALASVSLARTLTQPIDHLTRSILAMRQARTIHASLTLTGSSRELDMLATTFNDLMASVAEAQQDTRAASVGAIRALAAALDARDPYTAGHSERVSTLSVAIGREMHLPDEELEVLRLGALLHDIGKIGIRDDVLSKPGNLTAEEFEIIKRHPTLGARILGPVPFLANQLPIVELHHERPDGGGYPYGLHGEQIPLLARIAHVADAFDAITTARAYRPGRSASEAIAELWRGSGSRFDAEVVAALVRALSAIAPETGARGRLNSAPIGVVTRFPSRTSGRESAAPSRASTGTEGGLV